MQLRRKSKKMKKKSLLKQAAAYPHIVWSVLFIIAPLIFVAYYAFTDKNGSFTMDNIAQMAEPSYLEIFLRSLCFAFIAICSLLCFDESALKEKYFVYCHF